MLEGYSAKSNTVNVIWMRKEVAKEKQHIPEDLQLAQLRERFRDDEAAAVVECLRDDKDPVSDGRLFLEAAEWRARWAWCAHNRLCAGMQVLGTQLKQLCAASSDAPGSSSNGIASAASALQEALSMLEAEQGTFEKDLETCGFLVPYAQTASTATCVEQAPQNQISCSSTDSGLSDIHCYSDSGSSWEQFSATPMGAVVTMASDSTSGDLRCESTEVEPPPGAKAFEAEPTQEVSAGASGAGVCRGRQCSTSVEAFFIGTPPHASSHDTADPTRYQQLQRAQHVPTPLRGRAAPNSQKQPRARSSVPPHQSKLMSLSNSQYHSRICRRLNAV